MVGWFILVSVMWVICVDRFMCRLFVVSFRKVSCLDGFSWFSIVVIVVGSVVLLVFCSNFIVCDRGGLFCVLFG